MDARRFLLAVVERFQTFNAKRDPRANALIFASIILLGGFMMYNFVGKQLTQVASQSHTPAVATPKPSVTLTPTPTPSTPVYYQGE
jgi:hypothetical protein